MYKNTEKYQRVVDELIRKSFPELKGRIIFMREVKSKSWYSAKTVDLLFFKGISIYPQCRNYSKDALKGVLAHELSHLSIITDMSITEKLIAFFKWISSKKERADFEKRADMQVIQRRLGKYLLQFRKEGFLRKTKAQLKEIYRRGYL